MINPEKAFVQNQIIGLIVSNMVNVDFWEILLRCPKCGIENKATLGQQIDNRSIVSSIIV